MRRCDREFQSLVPTTDRQIAERFWRRMDWNVQRDGPRRARYLKFEWAENVLWAVAPHLPNWFTWELTPSFTEAQNLVASPELGMQLSPEADVVIVLILPSDCFSVT
jgi:hypothetical protein